MFKIEKDDDGNALDNVMFYGISAKRYCLYKIDNSEINILKYSTHGLGHLLGINGKDIWKEILLRKGLSKYEDKVAVSQITISKPLILKRFSKMNENKPLSKQIKPFNFVLVGSQTNGVIPLLPYQNNITGIQYKQFIDYRTNTPSSKLPHYLSYYWKNLEDILISYIIHNDKKFDYDGEGIAHRKHIVIDRIRYIGKESNNLEETSHLGIGEDSYLEYENVNEFKEWILNLDYNEIRDSGISERGLQNFKKKIREGKGLQNKSKISNILIRIYKGIPLKTANPLSNPIFN